MAAVDYFLKIDAVEGESRDPRHKGEIDVESWSFGASNPGSFAHAVAGKVSVQDFHFVMHTNKASPKLFQACATGQPLKQAVLTATRRAGEVPQDFLKWTFTNLLVSSYQTGGSAVDVIPTDSISLNFAKVEVEYRPQNADGTLGAPIRAGFDLTAHRAP